MDSLYGEVLPVYGRRPAASGGKRTSNRLILSGKDLSVEDDGGCLVILHRWWELESCRLWLINAAHTAGGA